NAPGLTKLHQAAALQLTLDRRLGDMTLHPQTVILAAGNLEDDGAYVTPLSSALANRFAHITLSVDVDSWLAWGSAQGISPEILAYIGQGGADLLYRNDGGYAFPSPRSWAMASRMLEVCTDERTARLAMTACIGPRAAEEFRAFIKIYQRINPMKVIETGQVVDFTKGRKRELSFMYAATFAVAGWLRKQTDLESNYLPNVVRFLTSPGLNEEFQFLFLRHIHQGTDLVHRLKALDAYRDCARRLLHLNLEMYA
ncbi:MAG: hypothetical protein VX223_12065, partial [Myxococcota bacterium]|nr:hypothetical protein [Myxococcota bacterium]